MQGRFGLGRLDIYIDTERVLRKAAGKGPHGLANPLLKDTFSTAIMGAVAAVSLARAGAAQVARSGVCMLVWRLEGGGSSKCRF